MYVYTLAPPTAFVLDHLNDMEHYISSQTKVMICLLVESIKKLAYIYAPTLSIYVRWCTVHLSNMYFRAYIYVNPFSNEIR